MSFFNNNQSAPAGSAGNTTPTPTSNLFGGGAFGAPKPAGTGLFGGAAPAGSGTAAAPASGGLFGNTSGAATAAPASGGLFGNKPASTSPAPTSGGLFGGAPAASAGLTSGGLFGATSAKPQTNLFGSGPTASSTAGASTTPTTAPPPNLFAPTQPTASSILSGVPKPADSAAATNQTKPGTSSFFNLPNPSSTAAPAAGGFGLPPKPAEPSATATPSFLAKPAGTAAAPATPSLFSTAPAPVAAPATGGLFSKPAGTPAASTTPTPAATTPALSLFSSSKPEEKKDASTTGLPAFSLNNPKEASLAGAASTTSGPVVAVAPPSMLRGKTIEEIVNKWSSELETNVREFNKFAGEVAVWDRALLENTSNVASIYSHVLAAEREQSDIDQSLDLIEQQQRDLSAALDAYEKATQEVFGGNLRAMDTGPADTERDKNYMLATELHTQLDDLSGSLTQMIESVNALSLPSAPEASADDPMAQISQILGTHLESLQWIDSAVREIEGKVADVEKKVKDSGYNPGSSNNGTKRSGYGL